MRQDTDPGDQIGR